MAEVLVSVVLEKLGSIILDGLEQEVRLVTGVKKEIKILTNTLIIIKGVLEDAEAKQVKNEAVKVWLEEFKDISYDAEDILDEWCTRSLIPDRQQPNLNASIIKQVRSYLFNLLSCFKPIVIRHGIGMNIKELNERLVDIIEKKQSFKLNKIRSNAIRRIPSIAVPDVPQIYGRVEDKNILINKLLSESSAPSLHVPVISIVGTGGFGKTTLAQLILKEEKVIASFEKIIWVCVSDPFLVENVAKEIIQQVKGNVPDTFGRQTLHKNLSECVQGRRFILVLDDVWSFPSKEWLQLKNALDCGAATSRIIVTSRSVRVAKMINSSYTHSLEKLSDDDCWSLFKCIAFSEREDYLGTFEDIGKKISKKCKGVPLAVRVIASTMCLKTTKQEWREVLASNIWDVEEEGEGFLPSILLSYYALPSYLKQCLMYFAVFPKDAIILKKEMIRLWMAQGYLGSNGSEDLEMTGKDYFDNLAMLSFLQDFEKDDKGNIISCKMHDLMHDFVQFLTKTETIILEKEEVISSIKVRHLCGRDLNWSYIYEQKNLRTLRRFQDWGYYCQLKSLHQLKCLRVLSLSCYQFEELPSGVERLVLLRYLDLSYNNRLKELPESVCNLVNLQTLILNDCRSFISLPEGIGKLSNLRHLQLDGCEFNNSGKLSYFPSGIGRLSRLRTLDVFIVGNLDAQEKNKEKGCTIRELKLLNHLQGHLEIAGLRQVGNVGEAAHAELKKKEKLLSLKMDFGLEGEKEEDDEMDFEILEGLQPHINLENLMINNYEGIRLPDWILSLSNLTYLSLWRLSGCLELPALGKLPSLEFLYLEELKSVKRLGCEFYGLDDETFGNHNQEQQQVVVIFPKLKELLLENMQGLEEWDLPFQNCIDFLPNLRKLTIQNLQRLQVLPALGNLKSLEKLKLRDIEGLKRSSFSGISTMSDDKRGEPITTPSVNVLFPVLKSLKLYGNVGVLNSSWSPFLREDDYPNLNYFGIYGSSQSSLPQGFSLLTSIQKLKFVICEFLDFGPDDLKHLTMLEQLYIDSCPILAKRFRREGEISSSCSHSYKIDILEEYSWSDVNVHNGFYCDNCEVTSSF
ncbi:hypothetical protein AQUCO_03300063v1 [Aquilegia coerulea]|uniref:AAA+ ATPase domain-containing protein n=1 Tax=Aquilegia coerulea TaxID=218851 RepID=A0A2G5CZC9_AQUCA|nr:hypothetical protein AQUCO_03300063v1 [Aquilegia coerulea]